MAFGRPAATGRLKLLATLARVSMRAWRQCREEAPLPVWRNISSAGSSPANGSVIQQRRCAAARRLQLDRELKHRSGGARASRTRRTPDIGENRVSPWPGAFMIRRRGSAAPVNRLDKGAELLAGGRLADPTDAMRSLDAAIPGTGAVDAASHDLLCDRGHHLRLDPPGMSPLVDTRLRPASRTSASTPGAQTERPDGALLPRSTGRGPATKARRSRKAACCPPAADVAQIHQLW